MVAMSGGVDSSVAALLLAREGYEVIGVTMRLFSAPDEAAAKLNRACCSMEDVEDARGVCRAIGARHYFMNFEKEFQQHVIDYFVGEYERGHTPHPCLACNDRLKFDFLFKRAAFLGADYVATGHYARVEHSDGEWRLWRGVDQSKDQSYVLFTLTQAQLSRLMLPVGWHPKEEIRALAREAGLVNADKLDSQDICFIPSGDYKSFVEPRLTQRRPGNIIDQDGNILAQHEGIHSFTVGQRKGLPIPGGMGRPMYVTDIDPESGAVRVGPAEHLLRRRLRATGVNWIQGDVPADSVDMEARIRYKGQDIPAVAYPNHGGRSDEAIVEFESPQRAITPGQAVVFYQGERVLGGGMIEETLPEDPRAAETASGTSRRG